MPDSLNSKIHSPPVNDTPLHRFLVLAAIKLLKRVRPHAGSVLLLSRNLCVKYGPLVQLSEASTMRYISSIHPFLCLRSFAPSNIAVGDLYSHGKNSWRHDCGSVGVSKRGVKDEASITTKAVHPRTEEPCPS
jgi:hypothetical protein